jgi:hypothetical protein
MAHHSVPRTLIESEIGVCGTKPFWSTLKMSITDNDYSIILKISTGLGIFLHPAGA